MPQAAPSFGQPRPTSRLGGAGTQATQALVSTWRVTRSAQKEERLMRRPSTVESRRPAWKVGLGLGLGSGLGVGSGSGSGLGFGGFSLCAASCLLLTY